MKVSPSYIRSQGYNLQEYAATHNGQTSPAFSRVATMLAWFAIYPRSESDRTLTASWHEGTITTEVTASLGPRGGLSSPEGVKACNTDAITSPQQKYKLA